jgi:hypothetical protein
MQIVPPGRAGGSSYAGKALFYWQRLKALGGFLHLQQFLLSPCPLPAKALLVSRKMLILLSKPKREDCGKDLAYIFGHRESFFELPA